MKQVLVQGRRKAERIGVRGPRPVLVLPRLDDVGLPVPVPAEPMGDSSCVAVCTVVQAAGDRVPRAVAPVDLRFTSHPVSPPHQRKSNRHGAILGSACPLPEHLHVHCACRIGMVGPDGPAPAIDD